MAGKRPTLVQTSAGHRLTIAERKRILLDHIYGVDVDPQAVEVTKLSLLLKVLEGETDQTLQPLLFGLRERALPDLGSNIKCGNALIGSDFSIQGELLPSDDNQSRVNIFDWSENHGFPLIMKRGGFDAVVGNPPYVRIQGFPQEQIAYFSRRFEAATGNYDLYVNFVEQGYKLLRKDGLLGFILPNKFLRTDYGEGLRRFLSREKCVYRLVDFGAGQVFSATTYTCLLFLRKAANLRLEFASVQPSADALARASFDPRSTKTLSPSAWALNDSATEHLIEKLGKAAIRLLDLPVKMSRGSSTGADEVYLFQRGKLDIERAVVREPLFASDFGRYRFSPSGDWRIIFPYEPDGDGYQPISENKFRKQYPKAYGHLKENTSALRARKQFREWYGYSAPRNLALHDRAQIAIPLLADGGIFALIPKAKRGKLCPMASGGFTLTLADDAPIQPEFLLGLLNSRLIFWRLRTLSNVFRGGWVTCTKQYVGELPIRRIDPANRADQKLHDTLASRVVDIIALCERIADAKAPTEAEALARQLEIFSRRIDELVYEMFDLSDREIALVESNP